MDLISRVIERSKKAQSYLPDFGEEIDTEEYSSFLDEYNLWDDVEVTRTDEDEVDFVTIKPEVQKELARSMETFYELDTSEKFDQTAEAVKEEVLNALKDIHPDVEVQVTWDVNSGLGYVGMTVTVSLGDESEDYEPSGLFYQFSDSPMHEDAKEWNWAAWLGQYDSPFYDQAWEEAYLEDRAAQVFEYAELHEINDMERDVEKWVEYMEE